MREFKRNKKRYIIIILLIILMIFSVLCLVFIDNRNIAYENFSIKKITADNPATVNIKIAQLSDMHFPKIKVNIEDLLKKLESEKIDVIAITGDLIDRSADISKCGVYEFIEKLTLIAPVYYVNGNHEADHSDSEKLYEQLVLKGVIILNNRSVNVSIRNINITLMGLTDNTDYNSNYFIDNIDAINNYRILLAHRPEKWVTYISTSFIFKPNLVLSGHAHGGQIRLFGKGLIAPNQGFFPEYDSGLYINEESDACMIVSRGIGSSIFPFRFNNKPHIPIITFTFSL